MNEPEKKRMIEATLSNGNGVRRLAYISANAFDADPDGVAGDLKKYVPSNLLPDVVLLMAKDFVLKGIEFGDENPKTQKQIEKRTAKLNKYFAEELKEGARRAQAKTDQIYGRNKNR